MRLSVQAQDGRVVELDDAVLNEAPGGPDPLPRRCYAAAHVVVRDDYADAPHTVETPGTPEELASFIDWDATMAIRVRHDACGMGIAEAMDTAQRFELGWQGAKSLLERTGALRLANGFVGGASTDQVPEVDSIDTLVEAWCEQVAFVNRVGGVPILLPQPWLTKTGADEETFVEAYTRVVDGTEGPILMHWLGEVFHPAMRGYFPGRSLDRILAHDRVRIRGMKLSLLDQAFEERLREDLRPHQQLIFTGDDHNFAALIEGESPERSPVAPLGGLPLEGGRFSHALLGIFDAVAPSAAVALRRLDRGDTAGYRGLMGACEALGRVIFEMPVQRYKSGIAFLAWLNGHQSNPMLMNHEERTRDVDHYLRVADLASRAGAIENAELAAERLGEFLAAQG